MLMPPYEREGLKGCQRAREDGKFICYWGTVGFDKIQKYTGLERLLIAIATEPDWVRDMYETDARLHIQMYEIMRQGGFEFDGVMLSCDIGYVNGPFISPRHYEQQLHPVFKELFGHFRSQGVGMCQAFLDNSDGKLMANSSVQLGCSAAFPTVARCSAGSRVGAGGGAALVSLGGRLIHTSSANAGGVGTPLTNRSGCAS